MSVATRSARHEELARFLRTRRERLSPQECGLPTFKSRKRIPGLRREDVSLIAGISTAYYTWIEQGRAFDISSEVLGALAGALRLSHAETNYIFLLAGKAEPHAARSEAMASWRDALLSAVGSSMPILVVAPWLELVETNGAADELFEIRPGTNVMTWFLQRAHEHVTCLNVEDVVIALAVLLRSNRARDFDNANFARAIERMGTDDGLFTQVWNRYVVEPVPVFPIEIEHATRGRYSFRALVVGAPRTSEQSVLLMTQARVAPRRAYR